MNIYILKRKPAFCRKVSYKNAGINLSGGKREAASLTHNPASRAKNHIQNKKIKVDIPLGGMLYFNYEAHT